MGFSSAMVFGARRVWFSALVVGCSACGYPDYGFVPAGEGVQDSTVDDVSIHDDVTKADSLASDTASPDDSAATDSSGADSTTSDSSGADSSVDDTIRADTPAVDSRLDSGSGDTKPDSSVTLDSGMDSGIDAPDTSPTCALIDDLEDDDGAIPTRCGRYGFWFTFNDATPGGVQTPAPSVAYTPTKIPGGRAGSVFSAHTFGSGFTGYGAGMGVQLAGGSTPYDARAWSGFGFWARVEAGTETNMRMEFPNIDTDLAGGKCGPTSPGCGDHFGLLLTFSTTWKYYVVKFTDLHQEGWGWPAPTGAFDSAHIYNMQTQCGSGSKFDVWIDDFSFVP